MNISSESHLIVAEAASKLWEECDCPHVKMMLLDEGFRQHGAGLDKMMDEYQRAWEERDMQTFRNRDFIASI